VGADRIREIVPHGYTRTRYGTGYYIYHQFARDAKLSAAIRSWNEEAPRGRARPDFARRTNLFPAERRRRKGRPA